MLLQGAETRMDNHSQYEPDDFPNRDNAREAANRELGELLVQRARDLVPKLRERAARTEELRSLTPETISDLQQAGLLSVQKPLRYGGYQLGYDVLMDVLIELGRGCGSTAWTAMALNCANILVGFPEAIQQELWSADTLVTGVLTPIPALPVDDGYLLRGSWSYASGVDHADWLFLGGLIVSQDIPDVRFFLLPKSDFVIVDDWFVSGLRGTGSKRVVVDDAFVPKERTTSLSQLLEGTAPNALQHQTWLYRVPLAPIYRLNMVAPAIGIALGAYEYYHEWVRSRIGPDMQPLSQKANVQIHLAECAADIDAAARIVRSEIAEITDRVKSGYELTMRERSRYQRDAAYCCVLCVRAVDRLYEQSGTTILPEKHRIQRAWRDIHALVAHTANLWDDAMQDFGRIEFGLRPLNQFFY
jgi:3-hydroxy-9,10-secoandrosta-1,3,5(10)-triene-9,17-dione monooxygenase